MGSTTELFGCRECGCTDIQCTAWVYYNSGNPVCGDPPTDDIWCPQCDTTVRVDPVDCLKPYQQPCDENDLPLEPTDPIERARFK